MMRRWRRSLGRLVLAVAIPLAITEGLLWIGHLVLVSRSAEPVDAGSGRGRQTILCVGDSHT